MSVVFEEVRLSMQQLSKKERALLAHELLVSLDETEDENAASAWETVIKERVDDLAQGRAKLISEEELFDRLSKAAR